MSETDRVQGRCPLKVWLADLTYTQQAVSADLVPAAVGGIATFAEHHVPLETPIRLFKYPEKLAEALGADGCPDVIGFSCYIWNSTLASAFAKRIKEISPSTVVIFGGPHYPIVAVEQERFLRQRPEIDFYIIKEGELAFQRLIDALWKNDGDPDSIHGQIPSVHSIGRDGTPHLLEAIERLRDLSEIPSPYLQGRLDEFFDGRLLPIIQTNRGCPFSCTFCVEGVRYYNKVYRSTTEKVAAEVDYIGRKMVEMRAKGGRNDLFIADSNFGMYRDDLETCQAIAKAQEAYKWPEYINVATGKNQKERVLAAAKLINGALRLSGSVQSLDPEVLQNIKRSNIAPDQLMKLALEAAEIGANSYSETILCLPGDTKERHYGTLRRVIEAGFNMVSTFQLMMLPGSEMCSEESKKKYGMVLRYRVFPRCYGHYEVLGERVVAAEVEEVCVGLDTMSFEDYLECRRMHLMIHIFHNDGIFAAILKYLRAEGLPVFRWLELLRDLSAPKGFAQLVDQFVDETRGELWNTREELEAFTQAPGNIERYVDGEFGNNLLFTYKTCAITQHINALADHARNATRRLLEEAGVASADVLAFIDDALAFQVARATNLFDKLDEAPVVALRYDIADYQDAAEPQPIVAYKWLAGIEYRFALTDDQKDLVRRYLAVFGNTPWGIGRMMTKVFVKRLLRKPARTSDWSELSPEVAAGRPDSVVAGGTLQS
jgi:radical SAM superfamily enzyme YgiQ (UPF0313 family)